MQEEYYEDHDQMMVDDAEIHRILEEYHRKQLVENLMGPGVSLVLHIVFLTLMFLFIVTQPKVKDLPIVVEVIDMEEVEVEEEIIEEIEEIEDEITEEIVENPTDAPSEDNEATQDSLLDVSDDAPMTDDNVDADEYLDVVRNDSPLTYAGPLGGRTAGGRAGLLRKYGGGKRGQSAVNKGLRWLAKVQNSDGSWDGHSKDSVSAGTGLGLLVFLAHGETPLSEQYGSTVQRAMKWLADYANDPGMPAKVTAKQNDKNGEGTRPQAYSHGIATYAISESYAMTKIPFLQMAMENAVKVIVDEQMDNGGFGYSYSKLRWDTSVAGWNMQALKAARVAGSTNPGLKQAIQKSITFLRTVAATNDGFRYKGVGGAVSKNSKSNMTGVGVVCLQLLGAAKVSEATRALSTINGERFNMYKDVAESPTKWDDIGGENLYGWYYDTQAVFNSQSSGGKVAWNAWRPIFEKVLIRSQNPEGYWQTAGQHSIGTPDTGGRVLATCLAALQLQVYYRYLPTFDIKKMDDASSQDGGISDVGEAEGEGLVIEIE